ncbi:MAG TPA: aldolase/citrate lyase family protein [Dinghuibacter sp.]|jgi:2-dehydro-3-deoxyglucarate aldolase|uniref:HpcH/HpaI aldolase family protein n=1 Tax=Dinghuibacter sp. TaxID=2024697 RepID=UPI002CBE2777|nr:aldolase/citrate lyase family protein [Dinghuibacter sp.]HTJ10957.1 aldolase/citrate lyase family protein [Dinghuibacter sp.]
MTNTKLSLGSWITLNHPSIAEIMAGAGFDWLCVDMEHSVTDYFEAQQLIMAIQAKGLKAFVRVGENNVRIIKRVLDAGADGIIVPSVNSAAEARKAVSAVRYPPLGTRGVGLARAQGYGFGFEEYRDNKAKHITLIAQIEHVNAVRELDEILATDGIDGTFIGPYDLSGSMGKPGQWEEPEVVEVLKTYETTVRKYDKLVGFHVVPADYNLVLEKHRQGYNFIAFSFDAFLLGKMTRDQVKQIKDGL